MRDVILDVRARSFVSAAERFHVPPHEDTRERERERRYIARALNALSEEFGRYDVAEALELEPAALNVSVLAGDSAYWARHPEVTRYMYRATFAGAGEGFILVEVCTVDGRPQIREFGYGLSIDRRDARQRIEAATKRLVKLAEESRTWNAATRV